MRIAIRSDVMLGRHTLLDSLYMQEGVHSKCVMHADSTSHPCGKQLALAIVQRLHQPHIVLVGQHVMV